MPEDKVKVTCWMLDRPSTAMVMEVEDTEVAADEYVNTYVRSKPGDVSFVCVSLPSGEDVLWRVECVDVIAGVRAYLTAQATEDEAHEEMLTWGLEPGPEGSP